MNLYSNGCSHSAGVVGLTPKNSYVNMVAQSLFNTDYEFYYFRDIPEVSSFEINLPNLNKNKNNVFFSPEFGKSNELIFHETLNFISYCKKNDIELDFVIIQWSGPNRRVHSTPERLIDVNPHDNYELGVKFEPYASITTLHYMFVLQTIFQKEGIDYVFVPYMELDKTSVENDYILELLDFSKFTTNIFKGHRNEFRKKKVVVDLNGHPNVLGNYILTGKVLDILGFGDSVIGLYDYYKRIKYEFPKNFGTHHDRKQNEFLKKYFDKLGDGSKREIKQIFKNKIM